VPAPRIKLGNITLKFDARPDRVDFRDREYRPRLTNLPDQYPPQGFIKQHLATYTKHYILDQGKEGACTGFGLATVINFLNWQRFHKTGGKGNLPPKVSMRMLYTMAKAYDEWDGEDYEGSSCRGAMKGWHKHGVCPDSSWPYWARKGVKSKKKPASGWEQDAARMPLGAYYRIDKHSLVDMQSAILEVGAVYVSSMVHQGWDIGTTQKPQLPKIVRRSKHKDIGGHAYSIIGYTETGFIVQNSWGSEWGYQGFAELPYEEWIRSASDAWATVLGAPMQVASAGRSMSLQSQAERTAVGPWMYNRAAASAVSAVPRLTETTAYEHTVVLGNNGRPLLRLLDTENAANNVKEVVLDKTLAALKLSNRPKLVIYAHGGLNSEAASIKRIRVLAPYFTKNEIHPLFLTWKTGVKETLISILEDAKDRVFVGPQAEGWFEELGDQLKDWAKRARDRSIEAFSRHFLVKSVWSEIKENARLSRTAGGGVRLAAAHLKQLKAEIPQLEIHLIGHSAGAILLGYLIQEMRRLDLEMASATLFAPACTVKFAVDHYDDALRDGLLASLVCHNMNDEMERKDSVWKYGKSLLYLVSRALEDVHKMPLLGLSRAWKPSNTYGEMWHSSQEKSLQNWGNRSPKAQLITYGRKHDPVDTGPSTIPLAHGSFDNDTKVVSKTIQSIRGRKLKAKIDNLQY